MNKAFYFNKLRSSKFSLYSIQENSLKNDKAIDKIVSDSEDIFSIELPTNENSNELLKIRHSSAHIMAMAVQKAFPTAKVTIGPWIDNG
jgi:threonyl-tRNA synthetase